MATSETNLAALHQQIAQCVQADSSYTHGFRDALESIVLALHGKVGHETLTQALSITADALANNIEVLPGATASEIIDVDMQDIVGDYDEPSDVPEWAWIEANASFSHRDNGTDGVWEFVVNLSRPSNGAPEKIKLILDEASANGISYVIFHQGT